MLRVILTLLISLMALQAQAQTLEIATGEWPPFCSAELEGYGTMTKLVTAAVEEMGYTPVYRFWPWRRGYSNVVRGDIWATFPYFHNERRSREVLFSKSLGTTTNLIFYYKPLAKKIHFETYADLKNYRVAGLIGYYYEELFVKEGIEVSYFVEPREVLQMMISGHVDLIPMSEDVGWFVINRYFPEQKHNFATLQKPFAVDDLHLIVSRNYPGAEELLMKFNAALDRISGR